MTNLTIQRSFSILGFPGLSPQFYGPVSALFFFVYLAIAVGNIFILAFVIYEKSLQKPLYLVFCHLALNDCTFGTLTLPKIIAKYWFGNGIISFYGCFIQMFFVHYLGSVTSFMLMVMAVDRFIAVCLPLRYASLITTKSISVLCGFAWFIPFPIMVGIVLYAFSFTFCKSNIIQCYCDLNSIRSLKCDETVIAGPLYFSFAMFCLLLPLAFILFSYTSIIVVIMKISNVAGQKKTLSTCSTQILITCLFYLPRLFVYATSIIGLSLNVDTKIVLIMLYSLLPPAINPFIYCLKTQDIKKRLVVRLKKTKVGVHGVKTFSIMESLFKKSSKGNPNVTTFF